MSKTLVKHGSWEPQYILKMLEFYLRGLTQYTPHHMLNTLGGFFSHDLRRDDI